jgi:hypothetical protein
MSSSLFNGGFVRARLPGPLDGLADPVYRWARNEVRRGIQRSVHMAGEAAYDAALRDVRALWDDAAATLKYLAALPDSLRLKVAYELFAAGFSHPLPKKFLQHYVWGQGADLTLSLSDMIDCNPLIRLPASKAFRALLVQAAQQPGVAQPFKIGVLSAALTNGTLGQFTVRTDGILTAMSATRWEAKGTMSFYDVWDFDPKDYETGGRSKPGETKARIANLFLPGKGFKIFSVSTPFSQSQTDAMVVWAGGTPHAEPDRIAAADVALSEADQ